MNEQQRIIEEENQRQIISDMNRNNEQMHSQMNQQNYATQPNHNLSSGNAQMNRKVQEKEAVKKVGATASRAGLDYVTGGKYENLRNKPIIGGMAKKAENRVGNTLSKLPGSKKLGGLAKKADDVGLVDGANKAMDAVGGKKLSRDNVKSAVPSALLNKNKNRMFQNKKSIESAKEETEDKNLDETESNDENVVEKAVKIKKLLPILSIIAGFVAVVFILLIPIIVILNIIPSISNFGSIFNSAEAEDYYIYSDDDPMHQSEVNYNNAIVGSSDGSVKGIIQEYKEKYNVSLDPALLNAIIVYRYIITNEEGLFTSHGSEDLIDSESSDEITSTNYTDAKKKIDTVAKLMLINKGGYYTTDSEIGGEVYNKLINDRFLTSYYKDVLTGTGYDARKELVDNIFEYASNAKEIFIDQEDVTVNGGVVSDYSLIHLQTCKQPYTYQTVNGLQIYNNPAWNENTTYPDYLNIKDYLKGVLYSEIGISSDYKEAMKAQAIAALTYLIHDSHSGFNLKSGEMYFPSGTCRQATCSPTDGCTSKVEETSTSPVLHTFYAGTGRFTDLDPSKHEGEKRALNESENEVLDEVLNDIFGKIMVKSGITSASFSGNKDVISSSYLDSCSAGSCFSQQDAIKDARNGMNYTDILKKYYSNYDFDIIDIREGLYYQSTGLNYNGTINLKEAFHYHQGDGEWASVNLCDSGPIRRNGCNITSAAIAISLLTNQRITPKVLNDRQNEIATCLDSSRYLMIMDFAKLYGLNPVRIDKYNTSEVSDMLQKLATGSYVAVARLASNSGRYSTGSGHYIALVGSKNENGVDRVLVWDPGTSNSSRDNYWADLNVDLLPHLQPNYSFILIGR